MANSPLGVGPDGPVSEVPYAPPASDGGGSLFCKTFAGKPAGASTLPAVVRVDDVLGGAAGGKVAIAAGWGG
jgi:hypothetical protein